MKKWKDILLTGMILAAAVMTAGCGTPGERGTVNGTSSSVTAGTGTSAGEVSSSSPAKKEAAKTMQIKVYYPDDQGMKLIAVRLTISQTGGDKYKAAMKALLEGTKEKGQTNIIPRQTKLQSVSVRGDTAYVDFSRDLVRHFTGGSTGEEMLVGSVVNTMTGFSEIRKVQILIDGEKVETLAGHMDLSAPLTRMNHLLD